VISGISQKRHPRVNPGRLIKPPEINRATEIFKLVRYPKKMFSKKENVPKYRKILATSIGIKYILVP
jgi:hypothetical protein